MAKQTKNIDEYIAGLEKKESVNGGCSVLVNENEKNKSISIINLVNSGIKSMERSNSYEFYANEGLLPVYNWEQGRAYQVNTGYLFDAYLQFQTDQQIGLKLKGSYEWYGKSGESHVNKEAPVIFPYGISFNYDEYDDGGEHHIVNDGIYYDEDEGCIVAEGTLKVGYFKADSYIETESLYFTNDDELIKINNHNGSANEVYNTAGRYTEVYSKSEIDEKLKPLSAKEELFIDLWNGVCGSNGKYNAETGFYELNGLTDITYEQAIVIYNNPHYLTANAQSFNIDARTNIYNPRPAYNYGIVVNRTFNSCKIEIANIGRIIINCERCFAYCGNLHTIIGTVGVHATASDDLSTVFLGCRSLSNFKFIVHYRKNMSLSDSPLVSYDSMNFLITNFASTNLTAITITVHPTTYSYLTGASAPTTQVGGTTEEWQALVTAATNKNISFATTN